MGFAHMHQIVSKTVAFEGIGNAPEGYAVMRDCVFRVVIEVDSE